MSIIVEPGIEFPTHHVSLSDGDNTIGLILCDAQGNANPHAITRSPVPRTAMKTTSGNQKYSDFEPPWSPVSQDDWSGGRGYEDFDLDVTRYSDAWRANTMHGQVFLGGQDTYTTGYRSQNYSLPGSVKWVDIITGDNSYLAVKFTASANYDATSIYLWLKRHGTPTDDLIVELCSDNAGNPDAVLQDAEIDTDDITDTVSVMQKITISAESLASGTAYWIKVYSENGSTDHHWSIGVNNTSGTSKYSSDGLVWGNAAFDLYYRITAADVTARIKLFQYKRAQYAIYNRTSDAPLLYINGDRGVADSNAGALGTLVDASKSWTVDEFAGCVVLLTNGPGANEPQPWRVITSNTATALTVDDSWLITHTTDTEYVILGSNKWTLVAGHGLTVDVTDILVINGICYLAQGDSVNMRRMRWYNNAGTATYAYAADGTNKAVHLCPVRDSTTGNYEIWRSNNLSAITVSKSEVKAWGVDLVFAGTVTFTDDSGNITGLTEYGFNDKLLWVFREGTIYAIVEGKPDEIPLREMRSAAEYTNGSVHLNHNVYLYFNFGDGLERYYNSLLDDVGPNRDDGLPDNRQGVISCAAGYPGRIFIGVDAVDGYSSVLCKGDGGDSGSGWYEIYRAPAAGQRVWDIAFQPIPGSTIDRFWVAVGNDLVWLPVPSGTKKPTKESAYRYTHESVIESGYVYVGLYDIYKFFHSLKIFSENLEEGTCWVEVDYRTDTDTDWIPIRDFYEVSPMHEITFTDDYGVNGKRIQIRLRLQTADNSITPIIKGTVIENVSRVPVKYSFSFAYRNFDNDVDLWGEKEILTVAERQNLLDTWANELTPLVFRSMFGRYDDRIVFIDPAELQTIREKSEGYIEKIAVIEI